ncbi:MAG: DUF59 domain-containing protein [Candidatus Magasanikbacteria bacterium]|nr:DUF59 domain-containing protein [Candidatus Magasanikbacteria bacterium]
MAVNENMVTKEQIITQLEKVIDPHIGIDIWTLGFIYNIDIIDEHSVHILMTLTTPMCPLDDELSQEIKESIHELGVMSVTVEKTFDPPWQAPEKVKQMLGI